jgi:hypothetical protein
LHLNGSSIQIFYQSIIRNGAGNPEHFELFFDLGLGAH